MRRRIPAIYMLVSSLSLSFANASVHIDLPGDYDGWTPTSVELAPGDTLSITATGCICFGGLPCPGEMETNPDGSYCWDPSQLPVYPPGFTCEDATHLSLVGKIGDFPCFTVGSAFSAVVPNAGQLFLAYNDRPGGFYDNSGSFSIDVSVSISPPTGACCFPTLYCLQLNQADCLGAGGTYMGDEAPCEPDPCGSTPVWNTTWGEARSLFR